MEQEEKKVHAEVYELDRIRLKALAKKEKRTMVVMFNLILDRIEKLNKLEEEGKK